MAEHGRILITGGAGYIGSVLTAFLLERGYSLSLLDQNPLAESVKRKAWKPGQLRTFYGDINDMSLVRSSMENVETVIYLAGVSDGRQGRKQPRHTLKVNVEAFEAFTDICVENKCSRFFFASTFGVYGNGYDIPLHESLTPRPAEPYSRSKLMAENILRARQSHFKDVVVLRLAMVYGDSPRLKEEFIVNRLILDAARKGYIRIIGGAQRRPQIHVRDVARVFEELLHTQTRKTGYQLFNVGQCNPSLEEIAREILDAGRGALTVFHQPPAAETDSFILDSGSWREFSGLNFKYDIGYAIDEFFTKKIDDAEVPVSFTEASYV